MQPMPNGSVIRGDGISVGVTMGLRDVVVRYRLRFQTLIVINNL